MQEAIPATHGLQDEGTHPPPLVEDPLLDVLLPLELEDGATQAPLTQVPPVAVQSVHEPPPVPHAVSAIWQVPVLSQHPVAQLFASQVVPPLLLAPLELVDAPPSSPLLLVLDVVPPELP